MKIGILTSPNQWFIPYAKNLQKTLLQTKSQKGYTLQKIALFLDANEITESFDVLFILSYHKILDKSFLNLHTHNIVIHASALPKGKGWSPLFHQILEGKNAIIFSLFEADYKTDNGDIYLQKTLHLKGTELHDELRDAQAKMCIEMCLDFLAQYPKITQNGRKQDASQTSFYKKRDAKDSELDTTKSIDAQFNLLRIVSNEEFPAFFYKNGRKYILKIYANDVSKN